MNVRFRERLAVPAPAALAAFSDPEFYALLDLDDVGPPEILDIDRGSPIDTSIRYQYTGPLPPGARNFIKPDRLTWVERASHFPDELRIEFVLEPDHYADRFQSHGGHRFTVSDETSCTWEFDAELRVRVPFVGGQVERAIAGGLQRVLAAQVSVLESYCGTG